jgi:hypothetical protein
MREGAKPPLIFLSPSRTRNETIFEINQFERGIKGVSVCRGALANILPFKIKVNIVDKPRLWC